MINRSTLCVLFLAGLALVGSACSGSNSAGEAQATTGPGIEAQAQITEPPTGADNDHDDDHGHNHDDPVVGIENDDTKLIIEIGEEIVNHWWYPETNTTYGELSTSLKEEGLVVEEFPDWEATPDLQVQDLGNEVQITRMEVTRFEEDNASFEVESERSDSSDEFVLTFLEFVKKDGRWQMEEIL